MSLEPLVIGSIKDRIVCCVWALGDLATPKSLNKAVECNSAVLGIAIECLQRDGYMHLSEAGHFVLHDDLAATLKPADRKETAAKAQQSEPIEVIPMSQKTCKKCGSEKRATEENFGSDSRTEDGLGKTCAECKSAANSKPKPRTVAEAKQNKRAKAVTPPVADELVIPAAGQIHCRVIDAGAGQSFTFQQGNDQVIASYEQLQIMRDWSSAQLKKVAAR